MSADLRIVAAEARFDAAYGGDWPIAWADLSQVSRDQWVADVDMAVVNAVAAQVRAQVAAEELRLLAMFEVIGQYGQDLLTHGAGTTTTIGTALVKVARIARGESA